jgi:tRNA threonylcarbamoyladenosine biosynthesis protein TsaE
VKKYFKIYSEKDLIRVVRAIKQTYNQKIFTISGELGVGKTTFIKYFCLELGVNEMVSSPTFSIVNEYLSNSDEKIFHFDFYRLENEKDAIDIGCEMYFDSGNYCFIEWPELIKQLLPENFINISINYVDDYRLLRIL